MSKFIDPAKVPKRRLYTGEEIPCIGMGTLVPTVLARRKFRTRFTGRSSAATGCLTVRRCIRTRTRSGEVFEKAFRNGLVKREELHITSKVWNDMHGRGDVLLSLAKTLKDLKLDYVDTYFLHWPFPNYHAPGCDGDARNPDSRPFSVEEFMATWRQLERIQKMGLARNIGMSNMTVAKLEAVLPLCEIKPVLIEMELHPCFQQQELFDYCVGQGIQPIGFCPIGSPTRPERDKTAEDVADIQVPEVVEIAKAHNVHPAVICLKWAVQRGQIPIPFSIYENEYVSNLRCTVEGSSDGEKRWRL